jgi:hypothetical protein
MTFLSDYNDSIEPQFAAKLIMALSVKAKVQLGTLTGTDPTYGQEISMIRTILEADTSNVKQFTRIFAANGVNNSSSDLQIQTAVDNNWLDLAKIWDPDVT